MNTPESLTKKNNNIFSQLTNNWKALDDKQKSILLKIWNVITYKWQLQVLFNLPFLIWWLLDKNFHQIHEFDMRLISYLNLSNWAISMMGFN